MQSYTVFCEKHDFPIQPTPDTISFYITYMADYIQPNSIANYLSGICSSLEPFFPDIKVAFSPEDLMVIVNAYGDSVDHDDLLFLAQFLTGFTALLRLGELCFPDNTALQDYRKCMPRDRVEVYPDHFVLFLPGHKADRFFEGNKVVVPNSSSPSNAFSRFAAYLRSRDRLFPLCPDLWLRSDGTVPTRSWFTTRLHQHFPTEYSGHSLRAGGATALVLAGVPDDPYIRKNPTILTSILFHSSVTPVGT
ncbi:hypothetical protein BD410DRAFT_811979 [Rickenella mellea]|uniref:DNA breaking-rejoining enzyme n=1 Tax=Rickenella mellea TaxID=50990 RepID=A0A4Y7QLS2_9AGAM|nr:hypothetical protein BD410DRAFT_811979 [Rickenella mellea]